MAFLRFGGNIKDDTGKAVKLLDPAGMSEWPVKGDPRIDALVLRVRKAMAPWSFVEWILTVVLMVGLVVLYVNIRPVINRAIPQIPGFAFIIVLLVLGRLISRGLWRARLHSNRRQVAQLLLEEGLCACCGYNFAGLNIGEASEGGLVTCPECGAGWERSRIERVIAFDKERPTGSPILRMTKRAKAEGWSVSDDRGVRVPLVNPTLRRVLGKAREERRVAALRRARRGMSTSGLWARVLASVVLLALGVWCIVLLERVDAPVLVGVIVGLVIVGLMLACLLGNFAYSASTVRRVMLEEGLCPACAGDISGAEASARDECVVCSGCRAAWRVTPPTRAPGDGQSDKGLKR